MPRRPDLTDTPPFKRAPLLLLTHRVVFVAILGAGLLLGLVVALTPQFLSSASSGALQRELAGRCDSSYAGSLRPHRTFGETVFFPGVTAQNKERLTGLTAEQPNLAPPRATIVGRTIGMRVGEDIDPRFNLTFLYRTGWQDRISLVRGQPGTGVSIDEFTAETYGVDVGDILSYQFTVQLQDMTTREISGVITVDSVHEDLAASTGQDFWCDLSDLVGRSPTGDRLPPVGLVGRSVFVDFPESGEPPDEAFLRGESYWQLPVELEGLTVEIADQIVETFADVGAEVMSAPDAVRSDLAQVLSRVTEIRKALTSSVQPLSIAIVLVALSLMGGAGSYWVDRRAEELELLAAYGAGPVLIGRKALLEMLIPAATGVAAGVALSNPIANLVGPGGPIEPVAFWDGVFLGLPAVIVALGLVGIIAAGRSRRLLSTRRRSRFSGWWVIPLGLVLILGAYRLRNSIGGEAVRFGEGDLVGFVDPLVILYPLVFFGGVGLIGSSLFIGVARRVRVSQASNSFFLALRRITARPSVVVVLIAGTLLPVATLIYSAALTRSTETSIETKGRVFIGSEIRAPVYGFDPLPPELANESTYVQKADRVDFEGTEVDLLVIDLDTFSIGAFWASGFAEAPLESILIDLDDPGVPISALLANGETSATNGSVDLGRFDLPVAVVNQVAVFPGARSNRPILVVGKEPFETYVAGLDPVPGSDGTKKYLWTKNGDVDSVERALGQADIGFSFTTSVDEALDLTKFQAIIWTFDFLELYAALAGIIAIGAVLLYAETHQRHRNLSYTLARRMGLTRREHLVAGVIEYGTILFTAGALAALAAYIPARSIYVALDPLPATPPAPGWVGILDLALVLATMTLVVGFIASYVGQRTADNADVSELLRHGG